MRFQRTALGAFFLAHLLSVWGFGQAVTPTIQIDTFENPANFRQSTIGNALTDIFITELARAGRFRVLDSSLGREYVRPDFHFLAKVTNFSYREQLLESATVSEDGAASEAEYEETIEVRIDFRVVDDRSREVVVADAGEKVETNRSTTSRVADFDRLVATSASAFTAEIAGSMMGRASLEAVGSVVTRLNDYFDIAGFAAPDLEGRVLGLADAGTAVIDVGSEHGVQLNNRLSVFHETEIRNSNGEVIYSSRNEVGQIRVTEIQTDRALAQLELGVEIQEGDLVVRNGSSLAPADHILKARRFIEKNFYAPALREARIAETQAPDSVDATTMVGTANLYMGNFPEAFDAYSRVMSTAGMTFDVRHAHTFGSCYGVLAIDGDYLSFSSPDEPDPDHWFEVSSSHVDEMRRTSRGWRLRAPSGEGEEKNWTFTILNFPSDIERELTGFLESYIQTPFH